MYLTDHYPPPGSMGSMGPYQYAHPGADYTGAPGYKMDYAKAGDYGRGPCSYDGMPPMMAHPGLDYDFTRLDIYGRAKQGRAKGNVDVYCLLSFCLCLSVCVNVVSKNSPFSDVAQIAVNNLPVQIKSWFSFRENKNFISALANLKIAVHFRI